MLNREEITLNETIKLEDYGPVPDTEGLSGLPARIIAQHRERAGPVCPRACVGTRVATGAYYRGGAQVC